ncbi:MAG: methylmalonyl-CoA mutase family protein, partial [Thermoplasmata archaeon]
MAKRDIDSDVAAGRSRAARGPVPAGDSDDPDRAEYSESLRRWEEVTLRPALQKSPERRPEFSTLGGIPVDRLYTPREKDGALDRIGYPGQFPYTRGIHPTMYRGRRWSMRMFSGFGTPEDTNRRFRFLLAHGESGLSIAFDDPTLYGIDADDPEAAGEVGKCGVNVSSGADMDRLLRAIPLEKVTTSMTINGPANIVWGMYLLSAEAQGT